MMTPLISVVIPTYNSADFIEKAIQSVVEQSYKKWEIIIVDNNSSDHTIELINSINDNRISIHKVNNNGVIAVSRNIGIGLAKGEWIAFLDSDDWWSKEKLSLSVERISDLTYLIYHNLKVIGKKNTLFESKKTRLPNHPVMVDLLVSGNIIPNSSVMVRKSILDEIGGIDESKMMVGSEDYNTWLKVSSVTEQFIFIDKFLGIYRVHRDSVSNKNMSNSGYVAAKQFLSKLDEKDRKKFESRVLYQDGRYGFIKKNHKDSIRKLIKCIGGAKIDIKIKSIYMISISAIKLLAVKMF